MTPQRALGCSRMPTCRADRPLPRIAREAGVALTSIRLLDHRRAVCRLLIGDTVEVTGLYAVDDGRITAACHYFSDLDLRGTVGVLEPSDAAHAGASAGGGARDHRAHAGRRPARVSSGAPPRPPPARHRRPRGPRPPGRGRAPGDLRDAPRRDRRLRARARRRRPPSCRRSGARNCWIGRGDRSPPEPSGRRPERTKARRSGPFSSSGGGIRTRDLRVMSPTSYQTAPPRGGPSNIAPCPAYGTDPHHPPAPRRTPGTPRCGRA